MPSPIVMTARHFHRRRLGVQRCHSVAAWLRARSEFAEIGRDYLGIELSEDYAERVRERLDRVVQDEAVPVAKSKNKKKSSALYS